MAIQHYELKIHISSATRGKSSLLIPDLKMGYLSHQTQLHGSLKAYFAFLTKHYVPRIREFRSTLNDSRVPNWNTSYQDKGQNLIKKGFIPDAQDWELFRNAAAACGVSICFLFVFLMTLEAEGKIPETPKNQSVERNSLPENGQSEKNREKFCDFLRKLDKERQILFRKLRIS